MKVLKILLGLLVLGTALLVIFYLVSPKTASKKTSQLPNSKTPQTTPVEESYTGWIEYFNTDLGLDFLYPEQLKKYGVGRPVSKVLTDSKQTEICINLNNCLPGVNSPLEIHSTSIGWKSKLPPVFLNSQGYQVNDGIYSVILPTGEIYDLPQGSASEYKSQYGISMLVIPGFTSNLTGIAHPGPGYIGAIINRPLPVYPGLVIQMQLTTDLTPAVFEKILSSVSFPPENNFPNDDQLRAEINPPNYYDQSIQKDLASVAKIVNCRYGKDGKYPSSYYPDQICGTKTTIINAITQRPYYYLSNRDSQGFIIRAKLSTGEIYTLSETTNPPPTPIPHR